MEKLYDLAFAFKKAKLWKKLWDNQLFAVKHSDGNVSYCSVMGRNGEHFALGVYLGESGLRSYYAASSAFLPGKVHYVENMMSQDCLMCSYENKDGLLEREAAGVRSYCASHGITLRGANSWPKFERIRPYHIPWPTEEEEDQVLLCEALEAALEVSKKLQKAAPGDLGLTDGQPFGKEIPLLEKGGNGYVWQSTLLPEEYEPDYKEAGPLYDLPLERARLKKKTGSAWACDVFLAPQPYVGSDDEPGTAEELDAPPYFPWIQMVMDVSAGLVLDCTMAREEEAIEEAFPNKLLELIEKNGRPRQLTVISDRTNVLYRKLAEQIGIKLIHGECEMLEEAEEEFIDHISPDVVGPSLEDVHDGLLEILENCDDFSGFPDEAIVILSSLADLVSDQLPEEQLELLRQEARKRLKNKE